jgi:succinate dehydrogenase / fumarate reductase cytochrome b subunit
MNVLAQLCTSSLGKKYLMAVTGAGLFLFVIGHLLGNLQIFLGPDAINRYAHFLQTNKEILWPTRIGLLVFVAVHIWASVALTLENRAARDVPYAVRKVVDASYASRTMIWSGLIVAAFVVYHLLHFTAHVTHPQYREFYDQAGRHDVYAMMVTGFSSWWVSGFYVVSMALLCWHLSHGVRAMFQSVGLRTETNETVIERFATISAAAIFIGYVSIPAAVLAGWVRLP